MPNVLPANSTFNYSDGPGRYNGDPKNPGVGAPQVMSIDMTVTNDKIDSLMKENSDMQEKLTEALGRISELEKKDKGSIRNKLNNIIEESKKDIQTTFIDDAIETENDSTIEREKLTESKEEE